MIVLREINREEYSEVKPILEREDIKDDLSKGIVYILIDNGIIIGVGKIRLEYDYSVLEYIVVKEEYRGLNFGDALLRSLSFKVESIGMKKMFYYNRNAYLLKKGFTYSKGKQTDSYQLFITIQDFFNKGCCGDENEI